MRYHGFLKLAKVFLYMDKGKPTQNEVPFFDKKNFEKLFYRVEMNKRARF